MKIKTVLTNKNAKLPKRANPTDAGADLFSPCDITVFGNEFEFIDLGVQIELPKDTVGLIFARSGLGAKHGIKPRNCVGVIDEKYRGNLGVMIENDCNKDYRIKQGDKIAQLVVLPVYHPMFEEVDELDMTDDRNGGWGHTGK